ncbi:MAG: histidine kinase [Ferruginibacter sp.]
MRQIIFLVIFYFYSFLCSNSYAQSPQPFFHHFTTDDGLPSSQVYQAMQDADGYMWFATDRGVVKYNGYEFKTFTDKDGLNDNVIFKLFQDYKKRIWMLSFSGRIFIHEDGKIRSYEYNAKVAHLLKAGIQLEISVDSLDNVYVTGMTDTYHIDKDGVINPMIKRDLDFKLVIDERINIKTPVAIGGSPEGPLHSQDLLYFTKEGMDSIRISSKESGRIKVIRLKNNRLLFAMGTSLFELKNRSAVLLAKLPAVVLRFFEDADQKLWICTKMGLYVVPQPGKYNEWYCYLPREYVSDVCMDRENGYWISTIDAGIYYLVNNDVKNYNTNEKLRSAICLTTSKSEIFAGYFSGSLAQANTRELNFIIHDSSAKYIDCIFYDTATNVLYVGNNRFGYFRDNKFFPLKTVNGHSLYFGIVKTKKDRFSGAFGSVIRISGDSTYREADFNTRINCIYSSDRDELFLGCIDGVYKYDPINKKITLLNEQLKDIRVNDIKQVNGNLCFATHGKGLMILMKDNSFKIINESQGLCNNIIRKLAVKKNKIWCTSYSGISEIIFSDLNNFKFNITNIRTNEGLTSNEINDIALLNDTVWVASQKGISFFSENTDFVNHATPLVHFISFQVNSIYTLLKDNYRFPHTLNNISIGFESPLFKSNGTQLYQYKLIVEGDSITGTTNNRSVQFLSLEPGTYSLFVKAINNSGINSTQASILHFTILAPWYASWWFRLLCLLLLIVAGFVFYKRRVKKLKEKFNIEKKQASLQLTAMRAQMNPHFIFNVMSSIRNYMQNNDITSAEKYLVSFAKLVRYTLDNSSKQEVSLEEELEAIQSFATLEMQRVQNGFDFEIQCDEAIDQDDIMLPSLLLQPFVENAIKHGIERLKTRGKISVEIKQSGDTIFIAIEDNGVGRVQSMEWNMSNRSNHNSFGTMLTFDRIEAFNKAYNKDIKARIIDLNTVDKNRTGTRVELEL